MMKLNSSIRFFLAFSVLHATATHAQPLPTSEPSSELGQLVAVDQPLNTSVAQSPIVGGPVENAPKVFSYGKSNTSILFLPNQIMRMKDAISVFESESKDTKAPTFVIPDAPVEQLPPLEKKIVEPVTYPVFFLSSIVYNTPNDWSLWMGGEKITSRKNETEVSVLHVTRDSATFRWKPDYAEAIGQRKKENAFAATDLVKNKLSTKHAVSYDEQNGAVTFTLRQNQSFAVGYFKLFEGYVESPKMDPIRPVAITSSDGMSEINPLVLPASQSPSSMPPTNLIAPPKTPAPTAQPSS